MLITTVKTFGFLNQINTAEIIAKVLFQKFSPKKGSQGFIYFEDMRQPIMWRFYFELILAKQTISVINFPIRKPGLPFPFFGKPQIPRYVIPVVVIK
jgi:hypothetical protein